jgi:hypothetical protein
MRRLAMRKTLIVGSATLAFLTAAGAETRTCIGDVRNYETGGGWIEDISGACDTPSDKIFGPVWDACDVKGDKCEVVALVTKHPAERGSSPGWTIEKVISAKKLKK